MAESTNLTILALFYYAFGLPAFAAIKLIVPAFYSTHDTLTPVRIASFTLGAQYCGQHPVPALVLSDLSQWRAGFCHSGERVFQFCGALCDVSGSLWPVGLAGDAVFRGSHRGCARASWADFAGWRCVCRISRAIGRFLPRLGIFVALIGGAAVRLSGLGLDVSLP